MEADCKLLVETVALVQAFEHGEALASADEHGVGHAREAFAEAEHVQGVKEVALAHAVVAEETVDFRRELQRGVGDILKVCQFKRLDNHCFEKTPSKKSRWYLMAFRQ